mgnify:CR=1 FL=1
MQDKELATVLSERGSRYGSLMDNATISQKLKEILHNSTNWEAMPPDMKEALHMIVHKISRIVEGDFEYDDSWIDISGYSTLIVERLHQDIKKREVEPEEISKELKRYGYSMQSSGIMSPLREAPEKKHL